MGWRKLLGSAVAVVALLCAGSVSGITPVGATYGGANGEIAGFHAGASGS